MAATDTARDGDHGRWMELVEQVLRGRSFDDVLVSATRDGIDIQPLYVADDADGGVADAVVARLGAERGVVQTRRLSRGWDVRSQLRGGDLPELRSALLEDLAGGVTSVELDASLIRRAGELLEGVSLGETGVCLSPHLDLGAAAVLGELFAEAAAAAPGSTLGVDPLGEWARSGDLPAREVVTGAVAEAARLALRAREAVAGDDRQGSEGPPRAPMALTVDAARYCDAGATEAQWLGWALATGIEYLRDGEAAGVSVDEAAGFIGFRFAVGADQFMTIAALRAARMMWARVITASGGSQDAALQHQHALTAESMFTRSDRWSNLLRATSAALAAGGGRRRRNHGSALRRVRGSHHRRR